MAISLDVLLQLFAMAPTERFGVLVPRKVI
jgi:hypothetical protein